MKLLTFFGVLLAFVLLTALTQIGGIVLIISYFLDRALRVRRPATYGKLRSILVFMLLYSIVTAFVVPPLAQLNGRVPLPVFSDGTLAPRTKLTALLNRHYVTIEMHGLIHDVADDLHAQGGPTIQYLDASFPFMDGFPLLPHLSHNDGKKLDLAFCYTRHGKVCPSPSMIGYGAYEQAQAGEVPSAPGCIAAGAWWYEILDFLPMDSAVILDEPNTRNLVRALTTHPLTGKIFLEPFLNARWGNSSSKIRFHGCHAVSHADHIHVQL